MRTLLCALLLSLAACPMDYVIKEQSDMSVAECNTLCDTEYLNYQPRATCSMVCGVGQLVTSLGTVPGGTCNYGVDCGGVYPTCQQITTCIAAFECCVNTSGDFDTCLATYDNCVHDDNCNITYQQCLQD